MTSGNEVFDSEIELPANSVMMSPHIQCFRLHPTGCYELEAERVGTAGW